MGNSCFRYGNGYIMFTNQIFNFLYKLLFFSFDIRDRIYMNSLEK